MPNWKNLAQHLKTPFPRCRNYSAYKLQNLKVEKQHCQLGILKGNLKPISVNFKLAEFGGIAFSFGTMNNE